MNNFKGKGLNAFTKKMDTELTPLQKQICALEADGLRPRAIMKSLSIGKKELAEYQLVVKRIAKETSL